MHLGVFHRVRYRLLREIRRGGISGGDAGIFLAAFKQRAGVRQSCDIGFMVAVIDPVAISIGPFAIRWRQRLGHRGQQPLERRADLIGEGGFAATAWRKNQMP